MTINVDLDGSGVTESIQTEETQSDGQVLESYYDAEWVLIKEVEYISYSDGSEEREYDRDR